MKQSVNFNAFREAFRAHDRLSSFSSDGLSALFDYLIEREDDTGHEEELDVVGLDSYYSEYENLEAFHNSYDAEEYPDMESIGDHASVILIPDSDGFIVQDF